MIRNHLIQKVTEPTVFVTKGRQRVKQYDNIIYLKNGDQFEIELFNPTTNKILAKISLNKVSLGSGIILRPGERVFLDRYFDAAKKFLFETYEVDNTQDVKEAISNNGFVEVEFYKEQVINYNLTYINTITANPTWTTCPTCPTYPTWIDYNTNIKSAAYCCNNLNESVPNKIETGRIEKGDNSSQTFDYDTTTFESSYTWKSSWKILPESQKQITKEDLVVYCSNCGAKRKKSTFKFCPICGQKF